MEDANRPFIEEPDEHETHEDELFCWIPGEGHRRCGGDCVSFETRALEDHRVSSCKWLNIGGSIANSLRKFTSVSEHDITMSPTNVPSDEAIKARIDEILEPPEVK